MDFCVAKYWGQAQEVAWHLRRDSSFSNNPTAASTRRYKLLNCSRCDKMLLGLDTPWTLGPWPRVWWTGFLDMSRGWSVTIWPPGLAVWSSCPCNLDWRGEEGIEEQDEHDDDLVPEPQEHSETEKIPDSPLSYLCLLRIIVGGWCELPSSNSISSSSSLDSSISSAALYMVILSTYSWSLLPMSHLVLIIFWWPVVVLPELIPEHVLILDPRRLIVNLCGSLPSFRIISGRILLLALMNQLQTWRTVNPASWARASFSASLGYALYRCSYNHLRRTRMASLERFPLRFLAIKVLDCLSPDSSLLELSWSSPLEVEEYGRMSVWIILPEDIDQEKNSQTVKNFQLSLFVYSEDSRLTVNV